MCQGQNKIKTSLFGISYIYYMLLVTRKNLEKGLVTDCYCDVRQWIIAIVTSEIK